jgi:hypothetical protein
MLTTEPYVCALSHWPTAGRQVVAHFDSEFLIVYQAFNANIARSAVADQRFGGGGYSFTRMSWIKPGFLWMMHRSGWATKPDQERVLALRVRRLGFDELLGQAVHSSFSASGLADHDAWKDGVAGSEVRLQWDPDHAPDGRPEARRALQIGLRGQALRRFNRDFVVAIIDVTEFAHEQASRRLRDDLKVPIERVLPLPDEISMRVGVSRS